MSFITNTESNGLIGTIPTEIAAIQSLLRIDFGKCINE